ncbi:anthranilate phosphoribosyltransferase [Ochrobactrum quorumnocens]|jgi:anthranilate phosphoribosyltransferase|uniref:Anthranilate phosphoribosyltransferase n=1 Tax=Ochrobactrum quorumnocens TaxID=271865 RepID=A0A248ULH7_9HYPH|nr:anthranilate phosphoribosyltransferase [[Ochrobactrum] quorumnocens]ASV87524.1 anthranilate phosphoribosyltransferase [[Ochrobactrum] quorumnocens]
MADLKPYISKAASGNPLSFEDSKAAFDIMMSGQATPSQIGGFLMALRVRGETVPEIAGAVASMRSRMLPVSAPINAVDIVGTGGDQSGSYNVSSCSAFVVAGAGIPVAKHGNRALSSRSGAADALAALGVNIDADADTIGRSINEAGLGFMFAPTHHSAMRHVGPSRVELGTRTIFNLLGPLSNPASVKRQLVGVFSAEWVEPLAQVLKELGSETAWVVYGDGLDEMTTAGTTKIAALEHGTIRTFEIEPEDVGLRRVDMSELKGGEAEVNARALLGVLEGDQNAYRDIVLLNSAAALVISGKAKDLKDGIALAAQSIDSGSALAVLQKVIAVSNDKPL